jgi:nicotinamidase-related amidase
VGGRMKKKSALVLVDFEREWIDKSSDYFVGDISSVLDRTNQLIDFCRTSGYKIIFTRHIESGSTAAFSEGTQNVEIIAKLHKEPSDVLITKNKISPFYKTILEKELKGVKHIVVCGILTNLCVRSMIQDAYDRDFEITVIKDCCVAFDKSVQKFTFKDLKETREEISFVDLANFLKQ